MFDREVDRLDARTTLSGIEQARVEAMAAEVHVLLLAAHWADLHGSVRADGPVLPGAERLLRIGGEGTAPVAEFAADELALVLETSSHGARQLVADALDLRHRLPALWARVEAGQVKPWLARKAAQATHHLPYELARAVDLVIAPLADRSSLGRLEGVIEATAIRLDPAAAGERERWARDQLGVWLSPETEHGTKTLFARLDAPDAVAIDDAVTRGAEALAALGDERPLDQRRAAAFGLLADPHETLELRHSTAEPPHGPEGDSSASLPEGLAHAVRRDVFSRRDARVYVHLTDETLRAGAGVARVEGIGPVTAQLVREWLAGARVTVVPVIDLAQQTPVDAYEIPDRLAEAVRLRSPVDCFPYATSTSRRMDLDHTEPYRSPDEGGPPGQTRTDNLAPLTRAHHRVKTHAHGWAVRQPFDGVLVWRTPHGRYYLVDHTGTTKAIRAA